MTLKELENYYEELLKADLKVIPEKAKTFFDIADFPNRETVISNFYSFYLDPNEQHGLSDLFISALLKVIKCETEKDSVISNPRNCTTEREVYTDNGKRIDIVVSEPSEVDDEIENAIIIENKVNAAVYNDLDEYYKSVKVSKNKIGVVLSIRPESNLPKEFVSITHDELLSQVEQSSGAYFLNADVKQIVILKEFIDNMKSMLQTSATKEDYEFFLKHKDKIKEISEFYPTVKKAIIGEASDVCEKLKLESNLDLELIRPRKVNSPYFFSKSEAICFVIWLDDFFNGDDKIYLYVELKEDGIRQLDKINKIKFTDDEKKLLDETTKVREDYIHYASIEVTPSSEDIKDFTNYIYKQITQTPLKDIFIKIERQLKS